MQPLNSDAGNIENVDTTLSDYLQDLHSYTVVSEQFNVNIWIQYLFTLY